MLALAAPIADPAGYVMLSLPSVDATLGGTFERRVTRTATLDGGSAFTDGGFSHSDGTFTARWTPTDAVEEAAVARMVQVYPRLVVSTRAGVYLVAPQTLVPRANQTTLTTLVVAKLSL